MIAFCKTSWKNDHICYSSCTETSWQGTWNLQHFWNHHTLNIYSLLLCAWFGSNLLKGGLWFLCSLGIPLVTLWSRLVRMLFPLGFAWWEVCSLMPHKINLCHLGVTCNCFDVFSSWLWRFHLLGKLPPPYLQETCLKQCWESLMVLETNSSSFKKNQKILQCKIPAVSGGYLARDTWACTALYHSPTEQLPCLEACQQVKSSSHPFGLWLAEIIKLGP